MAEFGEMLHQIVSDFRSRLRFADGELLVPKVTPRDFLSSGQFMSGRHHYINALVPQMRNVAAFSRRRAGQEGDIQSVLLDRRNMFGSVTFDIVDSHLGMIGTKGIQQLGDETGSHRGHQTDPDNARLTPSDGAGIKRSMGELVQRPACPSDEALTCNREPDATMSADEQGSANVVFQIADTTADSTRINAEMPGGAAYPAMFRRGDHVAQMTKLKAGFIRSRHIGLIYKSTFSPTHESE